VSGNAEASFPLFLWALQACTVGLEAC